jgi:hypothetical protein
LRRKQGEFSLKEFKKKKKMLIHQCEIECGGKKKPEEL